jgi:hypothetical protein
MIVGGSGIDRGSARRVPEGVPGTLSFRQRRRRLADRDVRRALMPDLRQGSWDRESGLHPVRRAHVLFANSTASNPVRPISALCSVDHRPRCLVDVPRCLVDQGYSSVHRAAEPLGRRSGAGAVVRIDWRK